MSALPKGWEHTTLREVVFPDRLKVMPSDFPQLTFIGMDHVEPATMRIIGGVPANTMKSGAVHFYAGDVLYGRLRPYLNKVFVAKEEALCSAEFIAFADKQLLNPCWLALRLNASDFVSFATHLNEGDRPRVDLAQIGEFDIFLPPRPEQDRIVAEIEKQFSRLDDAISALRRVQANLKRYRASVLKAACEGRLVPTEAELARKENRNYEPASELLKRILAERRTKWEADQLTKMKAVGKSPNDDAWKKKYTEPSPPAIKGLPELPEGWTWTSWEQVSLRVTVGHVGPMKHRYVSTGIPFLRSQNVRANKFDPDGLLFIPDDFHRELAKSKLQPGDVVVVRSGTVGTTCVVPDHLGESNCADLVIIQQPLGINSAYGAYYMNSTAQQLIAAGKVGVALTHFNTGSVSDLPVPLPPSPEQARIVQETERRLSTIDELEHSIASRILQARALRQTILRNAFQGKLVPQDLNDEPASVLIERIRSLRDTSGNRRRSSSTTTTPVAVAAEAR